MSKMLRPLVIILLLLSIASLVFGILLFNKREDLKGRIVELEKATMRTVAALAAPREPSVAGSSHVVEAQDVTINTNNLMVYTNMYISINKLYALTDNRYEELVQAYADLDVMDARLAETNRVLLATEEELERTRQRVAELENIRDQLQGDLARANQRITELETDKVNLENEIDDLNSTIITCEEDKRDMEDEKASLEQQLTICQGQLNPLARQVPDGLTGEIVYVNPDWNFAVLDLGSDNDLTPTVTMLVHRGKKLVGRLVISHVTEKMSIAEIQREWLNDTIKPGDTVFYPGAGGSM